VNLRPLVLAAAVAVAALAAAVVPAAARAGTYSVSIDTAKNADGWTFSHDDGFIACSLQLRGSNCTDVASPSPLWIFGFGHAPKLANAWWQWDAPATTTIRSGALAVTYKTAATGTSAYMKARLRTESFPSSPQLYPTTGNGSASWSIPSGNQVVGVFLKTDVARDYADKWNDNVKVTGLTATLTDDTPPAFSLSGPLADGLWHNEAQPVAVGVDASDAGAGVASAVLGESGTTLDSAAVPHQSGLHAGLTAYSTRLATTPAALGDGVHTLAVTVADAAGEQLSQQLQLRVDAHAPVAGSMLPAGSTTDQRPTVSFSVDPGPSGLGQFEANVDGAPMTIAGADASYTPASDLSYGQHTVTWHATDGAGNVRDGFWTFTVRDAVPPVLSDVRPDDGSATADARPPISVAVADAGVGVDPASVRMSVDGVDVSARGAFAAGRFTYTPSAALSFGRHTVVATAADTAGNRSAATAWSFDVSDDTPPDISARTPVAGSTVAGATPIGFQLSDDGSGVDPAALHVTVDGSDVTAWGTLANDRFTYAPGTLAAGVHTVSVTAADRAGNVAGPVMWQFAVADPATLDLRTGGPRAITVGKRIVIRFTARTNGSPLAGARIVISSRPAGQGAMHVIRVLQANAAGIADLTVAPARNTAYRAALDAAPTVVATTAVSVRQRVTLAADRLRMARGGAVRLVGRVTPALPGHRVRIQLLTRSGWRTVAQPRLGAASRYAKPLIAALPGRYVFRVVAAATARNAAGQSATVTVLVR
jgi:Big-like domain-containing protein